MNDEMIREMDDKIKEISRELLEVLDKNKFGISYDKDQTYNIRARYIHTANDRLQKSCVREVIENLKENDYLIKKYKDLLKIKYEKYTELRKIENKKNNISISKYDMSFEDFLKSDEKKPPFIFEEIIEQVK